MGDKIDKGILNNNSINGIPEHVISRLNDKQLQTVLIGNNDAEREKRKAGKLGEFFGADTENASIHVALVICIVLILLCVMDLIHSFWVEGTLTSEVWEMIFPVITLSLGYIFGKGESTGG